MGWFSSKKPDQGAVEYPGGAFDSATGAIAEIIRRQRQAGQGWATITLPNTPGAGGRPLKIQASGDSINLLQVDLDHHLATKLGLESEDHGLYTAPGADAEQMAQLIDAILHEHFGVADGYAVRAKLEG